MNYISINAFYFQNHMKNVSKLCELNTEYSNAEQNRQY